MTPSLVSVALVLCIGTASPGEQEPIASPSQAYEGRGGPATGTWPGVRLTGQIKPGVGPQESDDVSPLHTLPPDRPRRALSELSLGDERAIDEPEVLLTPNDLEPFGCDALGTRSNQLDLAWQKGDYRVVPYGIGWLSMAYESSRMPTAPIYVLSNDLEGEASFDINARATRLGFEVAGPRILGADTAGRIEFDFFGQAETENRAGLLLRQAYGEFKTPDWRVLAGQTWDVISPLFPTMVNYAVGWAGGNIGYRRAQLRAERYYHIDQDRKITVQASANRTVVSDFSSGGNIEGEDAGWPTIMGRTALTVGAGADPKHTLEVGVSGHIGQEEVDFLAAPPQDDKRFLSWSFSCDAHVPLGERFGVQGEFFFGDVLGTFLGGINQGIDPVGRVGIFSIGGWVELWMYLSDQVHCHLGYGIDDPRDADLSYWPGGRRSRNQFYFGNVIYQVTPQFDVGLELSWFQTDYVDLAGGDCFRVEVAVRYNF